MQKTNISSLEQESLILHEKNHGKIQINSIHPVTNKQDLSLYYSPGVARSCLEIYEHPEKVYDYTLKKRVIAVVSDGSAVLGLGNIGAEAAIPVMEGKCLLFREFAGVEAFPICLKTQDTEEIIRTCHLIAPVFGGINLEDISAPRCVEIERRLQQELDIPVFHDDQKGTAVVVSAALLNVARLLKLKLASLRVALSGTGAAGGSVARMLKQIGISTIYAYNVQGIVTKEKYYQYDFALQELIDDGIITPYDPMQEDTLSEIVQGADVFVGVSVANILTKEMIQSMNRKIVFALANPNPEISYENALQANCEIFATGRSDYPNQVNNVLAFPGLFKGVLASGAKQITEEMAMIAMAALSSYVKDEELSSTYILPNPLDKNVAEHIAQQIITYVKSRQ